MISKADRRRTNLAFRKQTDGSAFTRFVIAIAIFATVALRNWEAVVYAAQGLMVFVIFVHFLKNRLKFNAGSYFLSYGVFALWCLLSAFWAHEQDRALTGAVGVVQFVVLGTTLAAYIIAERSPHFLLDCLAWSTAGLALVLLVLTPTDVWREALQQTAVASSDENRLGYTVRYHPNALGRVMMIGALLWVYKFRIASKNRFPIALMAVGLVGILILTKSRLSIALFVVILVLFILLTSKNAAKLALRSGVGALILSAAYWAMMNIPVLYAAVGFRFAAMLGLTGSVDASTSTRVEMTKIALELFARQPLWGVGFENYSYYYYYDYSGWAETYAHSNFAELLASLGLVGMISYYVIPIWLTISLLRLFRRIDPEKRTLVALLLVLAVSQLIADFASIAYTNEFVQLTTVLVYCSVRAMSLENKRRTFSAKSALTSNATPAVLP